MLRDNSIDTSNLSIEQALDLAVGFQEKGDLVRAEDLYLQILAAKPNHPVARFLLNQVDGAIAAATGAPSSSRILLEALYQHDSQYYAVLPYNINWMLHDVSSISSFLTQNPIVLADIGARGGSLEELDGLKQYISYYGFDADRTECERLKLNPPAGFASHKVFPYYVGSSSGPIQFNIYRSAGESSRLNPNPRFQNLFNPNLAIDHTVSVESSTLDSIIEKERLLYPEIVKLDTQGTELEILQASPNAIDHALMVEVEVEFTEIYAGQALFHDVASFMYSKGFELLYINRVFHSRHTYPDESRGQLTFGDALFGRREDSLAKITLERLAKYCVLLINYGYLDIAHLLWSAVAELRALLPGFEVLLRSTKDPLKAPARLIQDKALCWQLHRRRTNQLDMDSDRSWPIR